MNISYSLQVCFSLYQTQNTMIDYWQAKPFMLPLGGSEQQEADNHFFVVVKDEQKSLANLEEVHTLSSNVSTTSDIEAGVTVFKVSLPENSLQEVPVASYTCNPQLRPIPMVRLLV